MAGSKIDLEIKIFTCDHNIRLSNSRNRNESIIVEEKVFSPSGGGFYYETRSKLLSDRHIIWRVVDNVVELEETSKNYNLYGNKVLISITDETFLPNVVIKETDDEVFVFISTTQTIHQLTFTHPIHKKYGYIIPSGVNVSLPSIFHNAHEDSKHTRVSLPQTCHDFDVVLTNDNDVYYGLITDTLTLIMVNVQEVQEDNYFVELKEISLAQRLWTGLVPSFVRGDSSSWMGVESLVLHTFGADDIFAFTICKDLKMRIWSVKTQICIHTKDLVQFIPDRLDSQPESIGALSLKKAKSETPSQLILTVHCSLPYSSQFIVMEAFKEKSDVVIMNISNFFSDFTNIQDFFVTNQFVWALWCGTEDSENEHTLSYAPIEGGNDFERGWHTVHLKKPEKEYLYMPVFLHPKEVYIEKIFSLDFFNRNAVLKALEVFVKTSGEGRDMLPDQSNSDMNMLKESVFSLLEMEVERNTINREMEVTEYQEVVSHCWSRFYSLVLECCHANDKPLGLYVDEKNEDAVVIRRGNVSFIATLEWPDHLYNSKLETCQGIQAYIENELNLHGDVISQDILLIFECMKSIPKQFNRDVIFGIDKDLDGNEDVKAFLSDMASTLITNTSDFEQLVGDPVERGDYLCRMEGRLRHINDAKRAVEIIMSALEVKDVMIDQLDLSGRPSSALSSIGEETNQSLCSKVGVQLVERYMLTTALHRMHLCRDFYILLKFMAAIACKIDLDLSTSREFNSITSTACYELLRSYHAVVWSAQTHMQYIEPSFVDTNVANLASLHLTEKCPISKTGRKTDKLDKNEEQLTSSLSCFLRDHGIQAALVQFNQTTMCRGSTFSDVLHFVGKSCFNQVWVLNNETSDFSEYLAVHGQYSLLNEYLHFCDGWCLINRGTKDFLLAQSYLGTDQPHKALKYFISAARGISLKERLLMSLLKKEEGGEETGNREALVKYFIKVMRLFEQYNYPQFVISAATSAITIARDAHKDDPHVPMLWSVVFKYHLELEHHKEAYAAIVHNPDKLRRQDCLRHFIITLCDRCLFQEICTYPYVNLEDEVVGIIEARARTMDITVNRFYDLLYSYHTLKNNYRKAATTMYEQACRLSTEMHGLKSLQKQAKCYLASFTALQLVDEKYAWVVRPKQKITPASKTSHKNFSQSPKRREDGEQVFYSSEKRKRLVGTQIVELKDLEEEYMLVHARLKLIQHCKIENTVVGPGLSAVETVGLLAQFGLFDMAFSVALKFELCLKSIFEALASKCANLVKYKPSEFDDRWNWLTYNEINSIQVITSKSALQQAFHLLQCYLKKFEGSNSSCNYKTVATKFLTMGCVLPSWLVKEYERINPAELLHLYICFDMMCEATELAINFIDAVLGKCKEQFGLTTALHATTPPVWLPYTLFDQILNPLRHSNSDNPEVQRLRNNLETKLEEYFNCIEITTCDKINYMAQRNSRLS